MSLTISFVFTSIALQLLCALTFPYISQAQQQENPLDSQEVTGSIEWVVRIAEVACIQNANDPRISEKVSSCYLNVPCTQIFHCCQKQTYGHLLDSQANLGDFCKRVNDMQTYYGCNSNTFRKNGKEMLLPGAILMLNRCQAKFLGIGHQEQNIDSRQSQQVSSVAASPSPGGYPN